MKRPVGTTEKVYKFVRGYISKNKMSPSIREIAAGCGLASTNTAYHHLSKLEGDGRIVVSRDSNGRAKARGFYLPDDDSNDLVGRLFNILNEVTEQFEIELSDDQIDTMREAGGLSTKG